VGSDRFDQNLRLAGTFGHFPQNHNVEKGRYWGDLQEIRRRSDIGREQSIRWKLAKIGVEMNVTCEHDKLIRRFRARRVSANDDRRTFQLGQTEAV
jgi:hypothetical protein